MLAVHACRDVASYTLEAANGLSAQSRATFKVVGV